MFNPSNAKATIIQSTQIIRFLKTIQTLSCLYSLESSRRVFSYEYPFARVLVIFQDFCIILYLATSSLRVKKGFLQKSQLHFLWSYLCHILSFVWHLKEIMKKLSMSIATKDFFVDIYIYIYWRFFSFWRGGGW